MGFVGGISSIRIPSNGYINHMMTIPILQACAMAARQLTDVLQRKGLETTGACQFFFQAGNLSWSLCYLLFEGLEVNSMWTCTQHK